MKFSHWKLVRVFFDGFDNTHQVMINALCGDTIMMQDSQDVDGSWTSLVISKPLILLNPSRRKE